MNIFFVFVLAALTYDSVNADTHSLGKCPHVEPDHDFHMQKMLGTWYAIQKTSTNVPCLSYTITEKKDHPGYYLLTETFPRSKLSKLVGLSPEQHVTGELHAIDENIPATMNLKVPLEIGSYKFTVFMTDYLNYAAVFSCKAYPLTFSSLNKWSAIILSRTPTLDIEFVEKVRTRLSAYNIDPFSLSIIDQDHCKPDEKKVAQATSDALSKVSKTVDQHNKNNAQKPIVDQNVDESHGGSNIVFENADLDEGITVSYKPNHKLPVSNTKTVVTKPKVDQNIDTFSEAVDQVGGGLNTVFENFELDDGYYSKSDQTQVSQQSYNNKKSSYLDR
ncbi:hypothetical protein RN001_010820 [Aquatica leii]|uniref:Apolipoprotein D n=1 Tax=Aquatica leii TaxID=1421715 RepID=A0AAN7PVA1_9COLE|nr:hypothetical protein RN001_010820 [Aquatica leii]